MVLPQDAADPQYLDQFETYDPTQKHDHEQLAKIFGELALNLVIKARVSDRTNLDLEQKVAALQLQATESLEDRAHTQSRPDQLLSLTEEEDVTDTTLQQEVERLQNALDDLHRHTDQREQLERKTRKELNERLQQAEALLERAETKIHQLTQQRHELQDELDTVHAELKHAYRLQSVWNGETHITEFLPVSQTPKAEGGGAVKGQNPLQTDWAPSNSSPPKSLDKLARNIPTFAGDHSVNSYLQDIDFHLQTVPNVTAWDKLYLLRITANRNVRKFLDHTDQPPSRLQ